MTQFTKRLKSSNAPYEPIRKTHARHRRRFPRRWTGDALLDGGSEPLRERAVLAEATLAAPAGTDLDAALLDVLSAATRTFGWITPVRSLHHDAAGWCLAGALAGEQGVGAPLSIALVVTDAAPGVLRLRMLTHDGGIAAVVLSPDTAEPAEVRVIGPDGERLLPTPWETSRRESWRRAVAIVAGDEGSGDLAELDRITFLLPSRLG